MNAKTRKPLTLAAVVLTFGLFWLGQTAAQSPHQNPWLGKQASRGGTKQWPSAQMSGSDCKQAKGNWFDALNPSTGGTTGTITNAGILNGTTETVYNPGVVITPDPNVVSYLAETTITTNHGQLKSRNVYLYNFVSGLWTAMGRIDPDSSIGRFAGATGVLYFNGTTVGVFPDQAYPAEISGEICFANE